MVCQQSAEVPVVSSATLSLGGQGVTKTVRCQLVPGGTEQPCRSMRSAGAPAHPAQGVPHLGWVLSPQREATGAGPAAPEGPHLQLTQSTVQSDTARCFPSRPPF